MNQETLDLIGRHHTVEEIEEKFRMARSLGFDNINMDLIVGLPGEDKEKVAHTLEKVEALNPDSLTVHSLALKRATRLNLFKDKYQEISFENSAEIMKITMDSAHRMEMGPYYMYRQKNMAGNFENVGYSREGKAGIYNILIMEEKQSILAAGAGASTKFVFEHGERIERVENVKDLKNYVERIDEMIERKVLFKTLSQNLKGQCEIFQAENGREALEIYEKEKNKGTDDKILRQFYRTADTDFTCA